MRLPELSSRIERNDPLRLRGIQIRFLVITSLLVTVVTILPLAGLSSVLKPCIVVCLTAFVCNLLIFLWVLWGKLIKYRIYYSRFFDVFLITIAVYYLGALGNYGYWLYIIVIIIVASLHGLRNGLFTAALSSVMYGALLAAEYSGILEFSQFDVLAGDQASAPSSALYFRLFGDNVMFFLTAFVSGALSDRLRRSNRELEVKNVALLEAQDALQQHMNDLERAVEERTKDLSDANSQLRDEISERARAEKALQFTQFSVDRSAEAIFWVERDARFIYVNDAACCMLGYSSAELLTMAVFDIDPDFPPDTWPAHWQELQERRTFTIESRHKAKDGRTFPVEITANLLEFGGKEYNCAYVHDITDRKEAERALQESEERYRTVLENSLTGICVSQGGLIRFANARFAEMSGYSKDEVLGKPYAELIHPDDLDFVREQIGNRLVDEIQPAIFQYRGLQKSGRIIWIEVFGTVIEYQGRPATLASINDITDRKIAEEALRESEQRYSLTLNAVPDMVYELALDGTVLYANETASETLGISLEKLGEISILELLDGDGVRTATKEIARMLESQDPSHSVMYNLRSLDNRIVPVETHAVLLERKGQDPTVLGVARDITERIQAEKALRESEEKYRSLFEDSKDVVFITAKDGKFIDVNQAGVELYGYSSKEELLAIDVGRDLYLESNDRGTFLQVMSKHGFVKDYELRLKRKDGRPLIVLATATAVTDEEGNTIAYRGIIRDITEKKELEQQLAQAQKMESIGTLAGGIAHDFNNLLGGILGYASLAKTKLPESHRVHNYVDTIEKGAMRAAELTAQLLAFARGGKYETRSVNLNGIIEETLEIIGRTFEKSIDIEMHLENSLPTVEVDTSQMQQVVMNLCVNARDAMPDGGRLVVETSISHISQDYAKAHMDARPGSYVVLSVTDTGMGMDKETMEKAFEPFFTTKEEGKGTGLGLSMVYGVVKNHGGYVHLYSEPSEGCTFRVYLPVNGKTADEGLPADKPMEQPDEVILVVDDDESIRSLAKDILESYGYRVLLAESGGEAIEIHGEMNGKISLVILDMIMPKMGGKEAFLKLKERNPDIRVLLSTGYSENGKAREIMDAGVLGFIQKPYQVHELLDKVKSAINGNGSS